MDSRIAFCVLAILSVAGERISRPVPGPFTTRSRCWLRGWSVESSPGDPGRTRRAQRRVGPPWTPPFAANACLGLMEPVSCGIGAICSRSSGIPKRGTPRTERQWSFPAASDLGGTPASGLAFLPFGPLPVTVPGCVDGWFALREVRAPTDGVQPGARHCLRPVGVSVSGSSPMPGNEPAVDREVSERARRFTAWKAAHRGLVNGFEILNWPRPTSGLPPGTDAGYRGPVAANHRVPLLRSQGGFLGETTWRITRRRGGGADRHRGIGEPTSWSFLPTGRAWPCWKCEPA